jgi:hypothetical protein
MLFLIVNLAHAFWASFCESIGAGMQGFPPSPPWNGNPYGSPEGGAAQTFRRDRSRKVHPKQKARKAHREMKSAQSSSGRKGAQSLPVVRDALIGSALGYIRFRRWGPHSWMRRRRSRSRGLMSLWTIFYEPLGPGRASLGKTQRDGAFQRIDSASIQLIG